MKTKRIILLAVILGVLIQTSALAMFNLNPYKVGKDGPLSVFYLKASPSTDERHLPRPIRVANPAISKTVRAFLRLGQ